MAGLVGTGRGPWRSEVRGDSGAGAWAVLFPGANRWAASRSTASCFADEVKLHEGSTVRSIATTAVVGTAAFTTSLVMAGTAMADTAARGSPR
jgi:hypothetical protein